MRFTKDKAHPLIPGGGYPPRYTGVAHDIKEFPDSVAGRSGPFAPPKSGPPYPPANDFPAWVEYFIQTIGGYIELLNAIQFDLDEYPGSAVHPRLRAMERALDELSKILDVGPASNPPLLTWPLNGSYDCPNNIAIVQGGFQAFLVHIDFDANNPSQMVTNCDVRITATGVLAPLSSSSSYLATSSSSR